MLPITVIAGQLNRLYFWVMYIPLIIYEDNTGLRNTLEIIINQHGKYKVVGSYSHCDQWQQNLQKHLPEVIIMDIDMPGIGGIRGVREIKNVYPEIKVIMYTVFDDDERIVECISQGANGYILKNTKPNDLLNIIDEVMSGGAMMSPAIAQKIFSFFQKRKVPEVEYGLTKREQEILHWLVKGHTYKMIASEVFLSVDTVKKHLNHIYSKLQVNCGTEAVAKAVRDKLV